MARRIFDVVVAAAALVGAAPLLVANGLSILHDDGGPVLFVQRRLGCRRAPFRIYKFRSMRDGRVTRVGRWLRATGLDELPQLANVLLGDMSLVGPRPLTQDDVARLGWDDAGHDMRWRLRPGIVGLAQLYAGRGARVSWFLDCRYVRARCLRMDAFILAATAAVPLAGKRKIRALLRRSPSARPRQIVGLAGPASPAFGSAR
jgi:lipopolysaccharide/colanic/teichoic acid biosynthesis glycosyltransferase